MSDAGPIEIEAEDDPAELKVPTNNELAEAFKGAAVYSNKVLVTAGGPTVRMAFLERREIAGEDVAYFRAAVTLDISTMKRLHLILSNLLENIVEVPVGEPDV